MSSENDLKVRSTAFSEGGNLPPKYSCEGDNVSPPLNITNAPVNTQSLVIMMEDHDAPNGIFDHWLVWNVRPFDPIAENTVPGTGGLNGYGKTGYADPCPPEGVHRYFIKVFALDRFLDLAAGANKVTVQQEMEGHILATAQLMVHYKKNNSGD